MTSPWKKSGLENIQAKMSEKKWAVGSENPWKSPGHTRPADFLFALTPENSQKILTNKEYFLLLEDLFNHLFEDLRTSK